MNIIKDSWPAGKLPEKWQRPEIEQLRQKGYNFEDPREIIDIFEKKIARYAGSNYAVAVDNCTNAIFLCLKYCNAENTIVFVPSRTYMSIPMAVINAGCRLEFEDINWSGLYKLAPYSIYDSATRFNRGMYIKNSYYCLSFQLKKRLPIGKGGMILTDNYDAYEWFKLSSFEGRHLDRNQWDDEYGLIGYNFYMTPDDAARGLLIFDELSDQNEDTGSYKNYPDLSKKTVFQKFYRP